VNGDLESLFDSASQFDRPYGWLGRAEFAHKLDYLRRELVRSSRSALAWEQPK
jgi:hypothetical protein